ncbi:MAG: hypothetical protein M3503_00580 [Actinomycetota bacterium]|nr:hypothetical protein [Actinomycetota bacterium]
MTTRRDLAGVWLAGAVTVGTVLVVAQETADPGDDPDPAYQRPGLLDVGDLPAPAPAVTTELPADGRRLVLFAVPAEAAPSLCEQLPGPLEELADLDIVVATSGDVGRCAAGVTRAEGPAGVVAAYGFRPPAGDVAPTGYAVVDSGGQIRYRTLDPEVGSLLDEVATIVEATP